MPTLVQIGAGNIGRGFIAELFHLAGWRVTFVEVAPALLGALRERGRYRVIAVDSSSEQVQEIGPVTAIDGRDQAAVADALAGCDLAATSVGLGALPRLGGAMAAALLARRAPLDVLVCENGAQAHSVLRESVRTSLPEDRRDQADTRLGCVRTSIGRMIPAPPPGADALDIRVEPYRHLPVERAAFRGLLPELPDLDCVSDFDLVLRQKLYLHNLTHAVLAYGGHLAGCATIPDCVERPALAERAQAAGIEACAALAKAHGDAAGAASRALLADLLRRYANRQLADPVARVARDPWRKLAHDDRLIGAARFCLAHGITPRAIAAAIGQALRYAAAEDEPDAARWNALAPAERLRAAAGLAEDDPLLALCLK